MDRRDFITKTSLGASALPIHSWEGAAPKTKDEQSSGSAQSFWPNDARLAISISLQFEAGGQQISGAGGLIPEPIKKGYPDLVDNQN
jgi:hypothetical protein